MPVAQDAPATRTRSTNKCWLLMSAHKGTRPPAAGKGRTKGTPNRITADLRNMILGALSDAGGREYLAARAVDTPGAFLTLVGKILPFQLTGKDGGPIEHVDHRIDAPAKETREEWLARHAA